MLKHRLQILQVHNAYRQLGGEDTVVDLERDLLRNAGHSVMTHRSRNPSGALRASLAIATAPWNINQYQLIRRIAADQKPDLAHVHNTWFSLSPSILWALRSEGIPVVWTAHNYRITCVNGLLYRAGSPCELCVGRSQWNGVRYRCYRDSAVQSTAAAITASFHRRAGTWRNIPGRVIALSPFSRQILIAAGLDPSRVVVKQNFVPDPGPRKIAPSASTRVLYVGRLSPEKGVDALVAAWLRTPPQGLTLSLVGDGPLAGWLKTVGSSAVEVVDTLPRERVLEMMLTSRLLLFPSRTYENQPMTLLEAMSAGLPVIVSSVGASAETVGPNAPLINVSSKEALAEMLRFLDDLPVDSLGMKMRDRWRQNFSPEVALLALERVYEEAMAV